MKYLNLRGNRYAAKLTETDLSLIHELIAHREAVKEDLKSLSNKSLAEKFDVHYRTIDRISAAR